MSASLGHSSLDRHVLFWRKKGIMELNAEYAQSYSLHGARLQVGVWEDQELLFGALDTSVQGS